MVRSAGSYPLKCFFGYLDTTSVTEISSCKGKTIFSSLETRRILLKTELKLEKILNRYNSGNNNFRSMDESSLEALKCVLWNAFLFIPIRLPVAEISSCKEKGNFWSFIIPVLVAYSDLSLAPSPHWPIPNRRQATDGIPRKTYYISRKNI